MIHKFCRYCRNIGHKPEMVFSIAKEWIGDRDCGNPLFRSLMYGWFHRDCLLKEFKTKPQND